MKTQPLASLIAAATPLPWSPNAGFCRLSEQLDMCREEIGTDNEWVPVTILDEEGQPGGAIVALCHPINAALLAHSPAVLVRCVEALEGVPDLLDDLAGDAEEIGFDIRAGNARRAAKKLRSALAAANNVPVP